MTEATAGEEEEPPTDLITASTEPDLDLQIYNQYNRVGTSPSLYTPERVMDFNRSIFSNIYILCRVAQRL